MSWHLTVPLVFHSSYISMIVVIVIFLVVYILDFFSPLVSLSEFVVWCETSTEASSDNEQAKRNDRLLGTAIKARASFGARLLSQRASFPLLTMPLRRLRSYLQLDDLWLRLDDDMYKETRSKNPLEFSLSLAVDLIWWNEFLRQWF